MGAFSKLLIGFTLILSMQSAIAQAQGNESQKLYFEKIKNSKWGEGWRSHDGLSLIHIL